MPDIGGAALTSARMYSQGGVLGSERRSTGEGRWRGMSTCQTPLRAGRHLAAVLALVPLLALPACSVDDEPAGAPPPEATATTAQAPGDQGHVLPTPPPQPTDDATSDQAALEVGTAAITAFARPDLPADQWWAELAPMLSPAATEAYLGTDPAEVPAHAVTGPAWSGESPSAYLAMTFVPTDAGDYAVLLVRDGGGAPWLVERMTLVPADATAQPSPTTEQPSPTTEQGS